MTEPQDPFAVAWWEAKLDDLEREIVRLAQICQVRNREPGVIGRVVRKDAAVCGTETSGAFEKLHGMLMMHLAIRQKSADALGQAQTAAIEADIVERLRKSFPDLAKWPPARAPDRKTRRTPTDSCFWRNALENLLRHGPSRRIDRRAAF